MSAPTYRPGDIAMVTWWPGGPNYPSVYHPDNEVGEPSWWTLDGAPIDATDSLIVVGPVLGNVADIATLGTAVVATMAELSQRLEALYTEWRSLPVYPDECGEMVLDVVHRDELLSDLRHAVDGTERPRPSRTPKHTEEAP